MSTQFGAPVVLDKRIVIAPIGRGTFGVFEEWKVVEVGPVNDDGCWTITEIWLPRERCERNDIQ